MFKKFIRNLLRHDRVHVFQEEKHWHVIELRTSELLPDDVATLSDIIIHIIPLQDNVDHLLKLISQKAVEIIGAHTCTVYWRESETGQWSALFTYHKEKISSSFEQPVPDGWLEKVSQVRRPLIFQPSERALLKNETLKPVLCVPLTLPRIGHVEGVLCMSGDIVHQSLKRNIQIVNAFASIAGISIENARLFEQVAYEAETGTYSRVYAKKRLNEEFQRCRRAGTSMAVILIDFDDHVSSSQHYRHILKNLGKLFQKHIREYDFVGRYADHTFLLVLMEIEYRDAQRRVQQILHFVEKGMKEKGFQIKLKAGGALYPYHRAFTAMDLLQKASVALFEARNSDKQQIRFYEEKRIKDSVSESILPPALSDSGIFSIDQFGENIFQSKELLFFMLGTLSGEIRKTRKHLLTIRNVCEADETWRPLSDEEAKRIVLKALYGLKHDFEEISQHIQQLIQKVDREE